MTFRTIWTPPHAFAPEWHDFRYEAPAELWADACRAGGARDVAVVALEGAATARGCDVAGSEVESDHGAGRNRERLTEAKNEGEAR